MAVSASLRLSRLCGGLLLLRGGAALVAVTTLAALLAAVLTRLGGVRDLGGALLGHAFFPRRRSARPALSDWGRACAGVLELYQFDRVRAVNVRRMVAGLLLVSLLAACTNPDQKLRESAAQTAREAASEVTTVRLAVEQLHTHRLWAQPARQVVADAEKALDKSASSFASQQPSSELSARLYEQVTSTLDDAETTVTAVRIALGNDDLTAAERQLASLRKASSDLAKIGELAP
jgi:hypothetical protein